MKSPLPPCPTCPLSAVLRLFAALTALLLAQATAQAGGILIDHPTNVAPKAVAIALATPGAVELRSAELNLDQVEVRACGDASVSVLDLAPQRIDLLADASVALPEGAWCGVTLGLAAPLTLETDAGTLTLDVPAVHLTSEAPVQVGEGAPAIELMAPAWGAVIEAFGESVDGQETLEIELEDGSQFTP